MHSILIFGDYRQHTYRGRKRTSDAEIDGPSTCKGWLRGGVFLIRDAIERMLDTLPYDADHPRPQIYGPESTPPTDDSPEVTAFEDVEWAVRGTKLRESISGGPDAGHQLRFFNEESVPSKTPVPPYLSDVLLDALAFYTPGAAAPADPSDPLPPGYFDPPGMGLDYCPDIVVFEDLNCGLRDIPLGAVPAGIYDWGGPVKPPTTADEQKAQFRRGLSLVLSRLLLATSPQAQTASRRHTLEPVVVISVKGPPPNFAADPADGLWQVLLRSRHLRQRTVVILDAADLREFAHAAISTGLSWESTAQDTVAELQRSPALRNLLKFSQVVVRFGFAGALHIAQRDDAAWDYHLYFDPERDDAAWADRDVDGIVLGDSSLFVAAIVRHLTRVCMERHHHPVLLDLAGAVGDGLPDAVRACQKLMAFGYGPPGDHGLESGGDEATDPYAAEVFEDDPDGAGEPGPIAAVAVPPLRNRSWSIVSLVTQGRIGRVARDIVQKGVHSALVQRVPRPREFARNFARDFARQLIDDYLWASAEDVARIPAPSLLHELEALVRAAVPDAADAVLARTAGLPADVVDFVTAAARDTLGPIVEEPFAAGFGRVWAERMRPFAASGALEPHLDAVRAETARAVERAVLRDFDLPFSYDPHSTPVVAPVFRPSRDLFAVDRREIEGIRDVKKLIKIHLDAVNSQTDPLKNSPLSLAVFGPPGAGKSFAVKEALKNLNHPKKAQSVGPYNLAQFSGSGDLDRAFNEITALQGKGIVPVAFFDEFDARLGNDNWGWLKFFLAPMEDGEYAGKSVHTAVFVFAGGTSPTYANFSLENRPAADPQMVEFVRAKGPDFVSRLKGHMDVVGVNPVDSDDDLHLVRRAVVLRSILARLQDLGDGKPARIDEDILRAILFVPSFKNGARSIRKLIEMCPGSSLRVRNSGLPPINQLNMVTDGKAFLDLLYDVSATGRP